MGCSQSGSSLHGISQAKILEWVAISFSKKEGLNGSNKDNRFLYFSFQLYPFIQFSSVTQSGLTLWPHGLQHTRLLCPSPTPRDYSNSCPLSRWFHPTISSSVIPFSSNLQSFPASRYVQMSLFFALGGQSIGVSASASVLPVNIQDWFPLGWTGWISLQSNTTVQKHQLFGAQFFVQLSHPYMITGKAIALTGQTFVGQVMSLLFNMLSRLMIAFLPRSKHLLISWLQSPSAVILEPPKIKSLTIFILFPSIWYEVMGSDAMTFFRVCF